MYQINIKLGKEVSDMEWTQEKLEALYVEVQKKAMTDEAFRKELLADSTKAIEALAGEKLPEGFKLKVIENDPAYTATMVLPDLVGRELTEEENEAVAGGSAILMTGQFINGHFIHDISGGWFVCG